MEPLAERRVLVTGAAGFVGSHLCEALLAQGCAVTGVDAFIDYYPRARKEANLATVLTHTAFRFVDADLRWADLDPLVDDIDVVIHAAAMPGLPRSWSDIDSYTGCNLMATQRLLESARRAGVRRFVQISTSSVYGQHAVGDEHMPTRPVSPYGVTKLAAEQLVLAYLDTFGLPGVILRYFSIYGPRQRPDMAYQIFTETLLRGKPITIFGDGTQSRANTFIDDCVRGTLQAIDGAEVGEIYNIGGGQPITLRDAADCIAERLGVRLIINFAPPRPGDQIHTFAHTAKARDTFGYLPTVSPRDGLHAQVAWHLAGRSQAVAAASLQAG